MEAGHSPLDRAPLDRAPLDRTVLAPTATRETVLTARRFRFAKALVVATAAAVAAYAAVDPVGPRGGDSWFGYGAGGTAFALMAWLMWLGVRKRRYAAGRVPLRDWVSAHIYGGILVAILVTLHVGFRLHWNGHALAYGLTILTVVSGVVATFAYVRFPRLITANRMGLPFDDLAAQVAVLDREIAEAAMPLDDRINAAVAAAAAEPPIEAILRGRLFRSRVLGLTAVVCEAVERAAGEAAPTPAARRLLALLTRKEILLARLRRDVRMRALLQTWMFLHIVVACAASAAIVAHVFAVFFLR